MHRAGKMVPKGYGNWVLCSTLCLTSASRILCKPLRASQVLSRCCLESGPPDRTAESPRRPFGFLADLRDTVEFKPIHKVEFYELTLGRMGQRKQKGKRRKPVGPFTHFRSFRAVGARPRTSNSTTLHDSGNRA